MHQERVRAVAGGAGGNARCTGRRCLSAQTAFEKPQLQEPRDKRQSIDSNSVDMNGK